MNALSFHAGPDALEHLRANGLQAVCYPLAAQLALRERLRENLRRLQQRLTWRKLGRYELANAYWDDAEAPQIELNWLLSFMIEVGNDNHE